MLWLENIMMDAIEHGLECVIWCHILSTADYYVPSTMSGSGCMGSPYCWRLIDVTVLTCKTRAGANGSGCVKLSCTALGFFFFFKWWWWLPHHFM